MRLLSAALGADDDVAVGDELGIGSVDVGRGTGAAVVDQFVCGPVPYLHAELVDTRSWFAVVERCRYEAVVTGPVDRAVALVLSPGSLAVTTNQS